MISIQSRRVNRYNHSTNTQTELSGFDQLVSVVNLNSLLNSLFCIVLFPSFVIQVYSQ